MKMIVMDEHKTKMQATVQMDKLNRFKHHLKEGNALTIQRYSLGEIKPNFRMMLLVKLLRVRISTIMIKIKKQEKNPVTLIDDEGNEIKCMLWGDYAQQFNDFLNSCDDHGRIVLVLQFAMMKFWDDEYKEVKEFRQRLFANQPSEQSKNTTTKISTASKNFTKDNFVNKHPIRNIAELLDVE
nr:hypothetical protein [Tanacetum cinerariifolium]